jgi:hypothetical protein
MISQAITSRHVALCICHGWMANRKLVQINGSAVAAARWLKAPISIWRTGSGSELAQQVTACRFRAFVLCFYRQRMREVLDCGLDLVT